MELWKATMMGLVEGLTEFLPVSSTGHLILTGHALGFTGEVADTFEIFIQSGAMLAVILLFWSRFWSLIPRPRQTGFAGKQALLCLALTTLPALAIGLLAHHSIKEHLFTPMSVALALVTGSIWILGTERFYRHHAPRDLDGLTWKMALAIGFFQCLALWPGMSRSASTILGAMLLGLNRKAATEYSFLAAVPVLLAAGGYDLLKCYPLIQTDMLPFFATGFVVSFFSAWLAIKFFIRFVSAHTLAPFAWYRLALAAVVWLFWANG